MPQRPEIRVPFTNLWQPGALIAPIAAVPKAPGPHKVRIPIPKDKPLFHIDPKAETATITVDLSHVRTKRQRLTAYKILQADFAIGMNYVASFSGRPAFRPLDEHGGRSATLPTWPRGDSLAERGANYWLKRFEQLFTYNGKDLNRGLNVIPFGEAIGVEIECLIPRHADDDDGNEHEDSRVWDRVRNMLRKHHVRGVAITDDGSLTDDEDVCGIELRCLTQINDLSNLKALCTALRALDATCDASCGLHVHIDCRDGHGRTVANRLVRALPYLNAMVPVSRVRNHFCGLDRSRRGDRYAKINAMSLVRHKTIEVRLHSGTTDFAKISNWIHILSAIARCPKRMSADKIASDHDYLPRRIGLLPELAQYATTRRDKFKAGHDKIIAQSAERIALRERERANLGLRPLTSGDISGIIESMAATLSEREAEAAF